ncbi:MAG: hypothetical protein ACRDNZ_06505, partial [Streptosporangiaceae bacterium]
ERSASFDAGVERALRAGDMGALAATDPALARDLMAAGRAPWQVLAGALAGVWPAGGPAVSGAGSGGTPATEVLYSDDPFGVAYLVATFRVGPPAGRAGG